MHIEFFSSSWDVISTFFILIVTLLLALKIASSFEISHKTSLWLFSWHTFFCIIYLIYSLVIGADSLKYYAQSLYIIDEFKLGTVFIKKFTSIFSQHLHLSYLSCFLIYNFFGFIGLISFAGALKQAVLHKSKRIKQTYWIIIFLPSVSFWSAALGKDSISFMAAGLALWSALNFTKRLSLFIFAVLAMLMVRPHMAAVMLASYALAFVFDKRTSIVQRFIVGSISLVASAILIPFAMQYAGLGDAQNASDIEDYIDQRQGYNLEGGSSVDISSMSLPMQLFTYLFRPLPFEAHSIFTLAASFDNVILLLLAAFGFVAMIKRVPSSVESNRAFLWLYVIISWFIFATTTANLGIAMRQKWMFIPMLIFLFLSVIGTRKVNSEKVANELVK